MQVEAFASQLRSIVPQKDMTCVMENLRDAPDLEAAPGGGVQAVMRGSHAENFRQAYLLARPDGRITLAVNCAPESTPKGAYRVFTNEPLAAGVAREVMSWLYEVSNDAADKVIRSNAKEAVELAAADFLKPLAPASRPPETAVAAAPPAPAQQAPAPQPRAQVQQAPQQSAPKQIFVPQGTTICLDIYGMNKALAMERANNPYVPMPDSCVVSRAFATRIIKEWQPPLPPGTVIVEAGNQAVIVKRSDLQLR